jgi:hypothetical protein
MVNIFRSCGVVIVVPRNESSAVNVVVAVRPAVCRTYVTHLDFEGVGVKVSNPGKEGGFPCLSHHGSYSKQIKFSVIQAKSCQAEIVVAWPLAQFSSCTCPTDARRAILDGYSRLLGVSHGVCIRVYFGNFANLDTLRAVGVTGLVRCISIGAANRRVGAGWSLLTNR